MGNIREEISFDVEKKMKILKNMLIAVMNSTTILNISQLLEKVDSKDRKYISEDEAEAIYKLAYEIKRIVIKGEEQNQELYKFLSDDTGELNASNLLKFVEYEVSDLVKHKISHPNVEWKLSVDKILKQINNKEGATKVFEKKE